MRRSRNFVFSLVFILIIGVLSGCAKQETTPPTPPQEQEKPVLIMGTNAEFAPFEFINEAYEIDGFDVDLAGEIAFLLDYTLEINDMDFDGLVPAVQSGRIDMAVAAMTIREDRLEKVNFSDPYFNASQVIVVREDNQDIQGFEDLAEGKIIAVQLGTTGDFEAQEIAPEDNISQFKQISLAFMELKLGRADAVIVDKPVAERYLSMSEGFKLVGEQITNEFYGIAIAKENTELLEKVNDALLEMMQSGKFDELLSKWFN